MRNIARTIAAVIESGSGVTIVRPFMSFIDLSGTFAFVSSERSTPCSRSSTRSPCSGRP